MSSSAPGISASALSRERRRSRLRAPFGDEDIPIVFAGSGGRELFHRRHGANRRTAFIHDDRMLLHKNEWYSSYPECPERQTAVLSRCLSSGLLSRCFLITPESASDETLLFIHRNSYVSKVSETESMDDTARRTLSISFDAVFFNEHTNLAARLAVGAIIQAVESVHVGDVRNAFCLTRPPGHHALADEACGFCVFNNVAIAAQYALDKLEYNRILIVDWDVHHGQATQYAFYNSSRVLYISIHRYDNMKFWPNLRESNFDFIGSGRGRGFNINIPLNEAKLGDADYLAIFHKLILPVAYEFDPDLVLVSAGYDCAYGCPLGQLEVSPPLFAHLTHMLMCLAEGKLVVCLEGGYYHDSLAESAAHTVSALLGDPLPSLDPLGEVNPSVIKSICDCVSVLRYRWRSLHLYQLPELSQTTDVSRLPEQSWSLVKIPTLEPEPHIHPPEVASRIDKWLSRVKRTHPVARGAQNTSVCLVYDSRMENHKNEADPNHPECPYRVRRAYELLDEYGLARRCKRVEARFATRSELLRVHTQSYVDQIAETAGFDQSVLNGMADEEDSIYFNRHTYDCARLAAGSVLAIVDDVCNGQSAHGVAVVRPPGHHALADRSMGFCFFNNVAVGVRHAQEAHGLQRIAIVDWDVHHGNGTEKIFESDPSVLYISVHRYDDGRFFPSSSDASPTVCGVDEGLGRTVQVAWNGRHIKDAEYIAVFTHLILPILYEFRPQLIFISAGYDAVRGDRLGNLGVSPQCFAHLTHLLLPAAHVCSSPDTSVRTPTPSSDCTTPPCDTQSKPRAWAGSGVILVLEGGYHVSFTAQALCHSVATLLGDCCPRLSFGLAPTEKGCKAIRRSLLIQQQYWKSLDGYGPIRSQLVSNDHNRVHLANQHQSGTQSVLAFTDQREAQILSRLEDLSLSDGASPRFTSPITHLLVPPTSTSFTLATSDPVGLESVSTSEPTVGLAARFPATADAETLQELGTDLFTSRLSADAGPIASTSVNPSSSWTVLQGTTEMHQLTDEFSRLHAGSPYTGLSERSSVASELTTTPEHRLLPTEVTGASGSADNHSHVVANNLGGNQVVAVSTIQDLLSMAHVRTDDIHSFFGLHSTQQLPERLFAIVPLSWCPHLTQIHNNPDWTPNTHAACGHCENQSENWVCLTCYLVYCSRYANSHMVGHFTSTRHPLVLSFADLSSWCYECESYVHNEALMDAKRAAHRAKFGVDMPSV